jgi:hypothetical protein
MTCRHCLRGEPEALDISNDTINKALNGVDHIGIITFTGGEPSLATERISYILKEVKKRKITVEDFYIITNGKKPSVKFMHALIEWYAYAQSNELSGLVISKDQYHFEEIGDVDKAEKLYKALAFYKPLERDEDIKFPIDEGRMTGQGTRSAPLNDLILGTNDQGRIAQLGTIYVNVKGDVIPSCDMSYKSQEERKIGSVHKNTFEEIFVSV